MTRIPAMVFVATIWMASWSSDALACTVPTPPFYDATQYPAKAVVVGTVTSIGGEAGKRFADIKISTVVDGEFANPDFHLTWRRYDGSGMCAPPGPEVQIGQEVRLYLINDYARAWELTEDVKKTPQEIKTEQAVARLRIDRAGKYHNVGGALSQEDPKSWLTVSDLPGVKNWRYGVAVSFTVSPFGTMENCRAGHTEKADKFDKMACKILMERASFIPPIFADEVWGNWSWNPAFESEIAESDEADSPSPE